MWSLFKKACVRPTQDPYWPRHPEPVIGEPILTFVNLFKANPKRFKTYAGTDQWGMEDSVTNEEWTLTRKIHQDIGMGCFISYELSPINFITNAEGRYLFEQINGFYAGRARRLRELKKLRAARVHLKERQRLIEVYR